VHMMDQFAPNKNSLGLIKITLKESYDPERVTPGVPRFLLQHDVNDPVPTVWCDAYLEGYSHHGGM
jgi:hypothetical protein